MTGWGLTTAAQGGIDAEDRQLEVVQALADHFGVAVKPSLILPAGYREVLVVNPGFSYRMADGSAAPLMGWILLPRAGEPGHVRGGVVEGLSAPIEGWDGDGCSGIETVWPKNFITQPDGGTGYMLAQGRPNFLDQTLPAVLKPNTAYTLLVEVYARTDFSAVHADEMIVELLNADDKEQAIQAVSIRKTLLAPNSETGFSTAVLEIVTSPDQQLGDLKIRLGMDCSRDAVRVNYDNVRLWQRPVGPL